MRICALSDTHMYRPAIPDGDVLIHAGDICSCGTRNEFESEMAWLGRHMHVHKIFVPGNHDRIVESDLFSCRDICLKHGITMLIDEYLTIDGVSFYGSPWTPEFMKWAFMTKPAFAKTHWAKLHYVDVLVTHGPPAGIFDACPLPVGCPELLDAVYRTRPKVHMFGHIHEGHGRRKYHGTWPTLFANISVLDGMYRPVADPILVIDTENSYQPVY